MLFCMLRDSGCLCIKRGSLMFFVQKIFYQRKPLGIFMFLKNNNLSFSFDLLYNI